MVFEGFHQGDGLAYGEAEFGFFAAGVLPLAGTDGSQPYPDAQQRLDTQCF